MNKNIYLFGTFGDLTGLPGGGGQTSARRIWHNLEKLGYAVLITNRHRSTIPNGLIHNIQTLCGMALDIICWMFSLLFKSRKNSMAMVIGYGGIMAPLDSITVRIPSFLGFKTVFYLKGGGTDKLYNRSSQRNKRLFKKTLVNSNLVLTEGEPNVELVNTVTDKKVKVCYMPNYIEEEFFPSEYPAKPSGAISILYFGRIDETKNVKLVVEIFNKVAAIYPTATITIVGKQGTKYANEVDNLIASSPYKDRITRIGHSSHDVLAKIMANQHVFLFPSKEPREGHSNALNEAMAWGLVPVVSSNNFLPTIVGDPSLVVDGYDSDDYVKVISNLIDNNLLEEKSRQMYERVKNNFTQSVIEQKLNAAIEGIFHEIQK